MSFYFDLLYSSEEPEEKKAHTEDMSSAQIIDGDLQANQAAYNYSAWYQVSVHSLFFVVVLYCLFPFLSWWNFISLYAGYNFNSSVLTYYFYLFSTIIRILGIMDSIILHLQHDGKNVNFRLGYMKNAELFFLKDVNIA